MLEKNEALNEFKKMWNWLYKHPAHDKHYYVKHVAKADPPWKNNCPLCNVSGEDCSECLKLWDKGKGSLCDDPESPLNKWRGTHLNDPNFRMWYAGQIADIANKVQKE